MTSDRILQDLVLQPPKESQDPRPVEDDVVVEVFALAPGLVPGFDASVLGQDEAPRPIIRIRGPFLTAASLAGTGTEDDDEQRRKKKKKRRGDDDDKKRRKRQKVTVSLF